MVAIFYFRYPDEPRSNALMSQKLIFLVFKKVIWKQIWLRDTWNFLVLQNELWGKKTILTMKYSFFVNKDKKQKKFLPKASIAGLAATIWSSKVPPPLSAGPESSPLVSPLLTAPRAATTAKYWITRFVFTVFPAPDSPVISIDYIFGSNFDLKAMFNCTWLWRSRSISLYALSEIEKICGGISDFLLPL